MRCVAEVSSFNLMYNLCMYYEKQKSYDKTELTFQPTLVYYGIFPSNQNPIIKTEEEKDIDKQARFVAKNS